MYLYSTHTVISGEQGYSESANLDYSVANLSCVIDFIVAQLAIVKVRWQLRAVTVP